MLQKSITCIFGSDSKPDLIQPGPLKERVLTTVAQLGLEDHH
jgi:hypothetical protein